MKPEFQKRTKLIARNQVVLKIDFKTGAVIVSGPLGVATEKMRNMNGKPLPKPKYFAKKLSGCLKNFYIDPGFEII